MIKNFHNSNASVWYGLEQTFIDGHIYAILEYELETRRMKKGCYLYSASHTETMTTKINLRILNWCIV